MLNNLRPLCDGCVHFFDLSDGRILLIFDRQVASCI